MICVLSMMTVSTAGLTRSLRTTARPHPEAEEQKLFDKERRERQGIKVGRLDDGAGHGRGLKAIVGPRNTKRGMRYKLRWEGYPPDEDSWEFARNVSDDLIRA